ncbi:MAG: hypothetical protein NTZ93_03985 [Candidatus Beckwithbacteria bacterium]|nr:hypothetical protein [Candidatus Beckwithbacteria bacterium]
MWQKFVHWIEKNEGLILILLLVIILRIPSLYEPYWYGDEGIYLTLGQALRKGLVWYRDIHDNKPPMLYLVAAMAGNLFYFRLILLVWFEATVVAFFRLMQLMLPGKKAAWYWSTLMMIGLITLVEGNIANAEIFMALPTIIGLLLVFGGRRLLAAGCFFSMAFLFKVPAGFDFGAVWLWLIILEKNRLKNVFRLSLGFILPILGTMGYYAIAGGLEPYVRSALFQNIGYLSSWNNSQSGLGGRALILIVLLGIIFILAKKFKLKTKLSLTMMWTVMALFGALLSARPYPHYLIQPAIPGAILISWFIFSQKRVVRLMILGLAGVTILAYWQIHFWGYPILAYYKNFGNYVLKKKSTEDYRNWFDAKVNQNYKVAAEIKEKTLKEERIFIWGDEPGIYALAERLPIGRYTVAYHIIDFNGFKETIEAWDKQPPKVVVVMEYESKKFPEMDSRLSTNYVLTSEINQALIYRRVETK